MIQKVVVSNFKSIRDLSLELNALSVLIGPNNAGKTNVLDIFGFLSRFLQGNNQQSADVFFLGNTSNELTIELSGTARSDLKYRYYMSFFERNGEVNSNKEIFEIIIGSSQPTTIFSSESAKQNLRMMIPDTSGRQDSFEVGRNSREIGLKRAAEIAHDRLRQTGKNTVPGHPVLMSLSLAYQAIAGYCRYNLEPSRMRASLQVNEQLSPGDLGQNLAQVLHTLHSKYRRQSFDIIEDQLKSISPGITELVSDLRGNMTSIAIRETHSENLIPSASMPDGILKLIGLLVILNLPNKRPLISIEEPENYIHPYAQNAVAGLIKAYAEEYQLAITTHSPTFLSNFDLSDILVVGKIDGETKAKRPSNTEGLKKLLAEVGMDIGTAWYAGHLEENQ
ncbi:MAG: hypothetical protein FJ320_11665 [SAR202 cluster bacterium]|nr:hypothetical protein [SAR202 cluster bacterium]